VDSTSNRRCGSLGRLALGITKPRRPVLGMVFAGDVDVVGRAVTSVPVGRAVYGFDRFAFGCYAEYKCLPADGVIAPKPANLGYEEAAALPYGGLLALSFLRGRIHRGQRVLVYGASGAVGTAAVQLAKHDGAWVTGVCGQANLDMVASLGADAVVDYTRQDVTVEDQRHDLVFVAVGDRARPPSRRRCRRILTANGVYLAVDHCRPVLSAGDLTVLTRLVEAGELRPAVLVGRSTSPVSVSDRRSCPVEDCEVFVEVVGADRSATTPVHEDKVKLSQDRFDGLRWDGAVGRGEGQTEHRYGVAYGHAVPHQLPDAEGERVDHELR
jgi:hypothetical protein